MNARLANQPDFIIIGAMKCATSTLHNQLNSHNSFFMTEPKEPNFFSDDAIYAQGFSWYKSLFSGALPKQLKGESSTHYTKLPDYPDTIERIADYCDNVKLIYIMRHPVDRLVSHYIHQWTQGVISCKIDQAIELFPELIDYSRYSMQIAPYLEKFGKPKILPLFAERMRVHPQQELQQVFDFLGVAETPIWHEEIKSNVSNERLRVCGWRDVLVHNPVLSFLRKRFVPKTARDKIKGLWAMKKRPELSSPVLSHVQHVFDKDLKVLGEMLGIELNCKQFNQQILAKERFEWVSRG